MINNDAIAEHHYWDKAAADPDVDVKYISDVDTDECVEALVKNGFTLEGKVLDIGCGVGRIMNALVDGALVNKNMIYGVDISQPMLAIAKDNSPWASYTTYRQCDGRKLPFDREQFDFVYSMLVFQHIPAEAKKSYIQEAARVLRKGGQFRVQFVRGDHHAIIDHNATLEDMGSWMLDAGFEIVKVDPHLVHSQWDWITGVKA